MTSATLAHSPEQVPNSDQIAAWMSLTPVTAMAPAMDPAMVLAMVTERFTRADLASVAELATAKKLATAASVHPTVDMEVAPMAVWADMDASVALDTAAMVTPESDLLEATAAEVAMAAINAVMAPVMAQAQAMLRLAMAEQVTVPVTDLDTALATDLATVATEATVVTDQEATLSQLDLTALAISGETKAYVCPDVN